MTSPGKLRSRKAGAPEQLRASKARTAHEKAKRRRYSASPGPLTPTKLRSRIKKTEKGQHLTRATEHRELLHAQLSGTSQAAEYTPIEPSGREASIAHTVDPSPSFSMQETAHPVPTPSEGEFEKRMPPGRPSNIPPGMGWHHIYGLVYMDSNSTPQPVQELRPTDLRATSRAPDIPTGNTQQLGNYRPNAPDYTLPPGSRFASPSNFEVRSTSKPMSIASDQPVSALSDAGPTGLYPARHIDVAPTSPAGSCETPRANLPPSGPPREYPALTVSPASDDGTSHSWPSDGSSCSSPSVGSGGIPYQPLDVLEEKLAEISASTGVSQGDLISQLDIPGIQVLDFFKIYRQYFATRAEEELKRLPEADLPSGNYVEIPEHLVEETFERFKEETPRYQSVLLDQWSIFRIVEDCIDRQERFNSFVAKLEGISTLASEILQFETATCAVGSDIHRDQELSTTICSPLATDFFVDRLCLSLNDVTGHLKAHAYDCVSRKSRPNIRRGPPDQQDLPAAELPGDRVRVIPRELKNDAGEVTERTQNPVNQRPDTPPPAEIARDRSMDPEKAKKAKEGALVQELKQRLSELTKPCGIDQLQKKIFLTKLPKTLAKEGWIIENWPEGVPFACDCRTGKGVAGLSVEEQVALLKALKDPDFPLRVVRKSVNAIPASEPVIIGVPPSPGSQFTHGRRRFLDAEGTSDRRGPPRLEMPIVPSSAPGPSAARVLDKSTSGAMNPPNFRKRSLTRDGSTERGAMKKVKTEQHAASETTRDEFQRVQFPGYDRTFQDSQRDGATRSLTYPHFEDQQHRELSPYDASRYPSPRTAATQGAPALPTDNTGKYLNSGLDGIPPQSSMGHYIQYQQGGPYVSSLPSGAQIPPSTTAMPDAAGPSRQRMAPHAIPFIPLKSSQESTTQPVGNSFLQVPWPTYSSNTPRQLQSPVNPELHDYHMGRQ
ncbi:hypothetical protein CVT26_005544 [Gymnopilus dilepis]|uniref:Uncharacterized protein n=1 Tax=Gymnopilus dilepis TaxID=231916 RepID=A0A409XZR1_9AGAR|nr:hypothetical protein CVT26_005544 [Gymnopilus dilepis]